MEGHLHSIKVASNRAGLSPHLIRIWERRYQAVTPIRTDSGRRQYSDQDIERLLLLKQATDSGETIGQIAKLSADQLRDILSSQVIKESDPTADEEADFNLKLCMDAIRNLDAVSLESRLMRATIRLGQENFINSILHPLLRDTGEMWADGRLKVAHEHLASAVVRSLLGSLYVSSRHESNGPTLISTTPIGQQHEFGALMVAVTAASNGWRATYLGPNLPVEEIVAAASQGKAQVVSLSLVYPVGEPETAHELRKLRQLLPVATTIVVGGRAAQSYSEVLNEINAITVSSLDELKRELERLKRK